MPDFPDFTIPKWDRRDWASKVGELKTYAFHDTIGIDPGTSKRYDIYTVPVGKKLYITELTGGQYVRGYFCYSILSVSDIFSSLVEPYDNKSISISIPLVLTENQTICCYLHNKDIVKGGGLGRFIGWEMPASEPQKPKNNSPEELYRCGEFNYANSFFLPDNEQIIIFSKIGVNKLNYLRIKNYGLKTQKKLASLHLRPEHAQEILDISHASPQKVKEVLAEYEKKYKPKKIWG